MSSALKPVWCSIRMGAVALGLSPFLFICTPVVKDQCKFALLVFTTSQFLVPPQMTQEIGDKRVATLSTTTNISDKKPTQNQYVWPLILLCCYT